MLQEKANQAMHVDLYCDSNSMHLAQLYSGFGDLEQQGLIRCNWMSSRGQSASHYTAPFLKVVLDHAITIMYDENDDYRISDHYPLESIDLLFKRSFNPTYLASHPQHDKVVPLGLNYFVLSKNDRLWARIVGAKNDRNKLKALFRRYTPRHIGSMLGKETSSANYQPAFESLPPRFIEPKVLFMAQVWRPSRVGDTERKQDREQINEMRVGIVRRLMKEFGDRFIGGIIPNDLAIERYSDALVPDPKLTRKGNFLELVKRTPICVASTGLLGSIGYKFTEYLAASRAVVTEANVNTVYGDFEIGRNCLTYTSVDECAAKVQKLMDDPNLRYKMMKENYIYYHNFVRPDMCVLNSLDDALRYWQNRGVSEKPNRSD